MAMPLLEMKNITKIFAGVKANDDVNLTLYSGEVHALLGENGAGKSTLMNILTGIYKPTYGEIFYKGKKVSFKSPSAAVELGIGMVHQHFRLIPTLTVAENILLAADDRRKKFFVNREKLSEKVLKESEEYGLGVDPKAEVWQLSVGEQQRVEIIKLLFRGTDLMILDEPSAVLTPKESESLFRVLRKMAEMGKSVVFISHKMNEVMNYADRVTVLRNGASVATMLRKNTTREELVELMMGQQESSVHVSAEKSPVGEEILNLRNISVKNDANIIGLSNVDITLHKNEIFGIAGVAGNGQNLLAEVIAGLRGAEAGSIEYKGRDITKSSVKKRFEDGIAFIPEDRNSTGLVTAMNMPENFLLRTAGGSEYSKYGIIHSGKIKKRTEKIVSDFSIRNPGLKYPVAMMSGGNQQKLIIGRELDNNPDVIVAAYPVRGLDIGTTEAIHRILLQARNDGKAVLLISEDLDELMQLCDVIGVLCSGKLQGIIKQEDANYENLGELMAGVVTGKAGASA